MSLASGTGLVSGINYSDIISKMRQADSVPITLLQRQESKINSQSSALDGINKALLDFKSKAGDLSQSAGFLSISASPSDYTVLTTSVTGGSATSAPEGTYGVMVRQLAQAHRIASQGVSTSDSTPIANGAGTFKFKVGSGAAVSVDVTAGMTLTQLRDKINGLSNARVKASIVNDGTASNPYRLVLTSTDSGQDNAISIVNNDTALNLTTPSIEAPVAAAGNAFNGTISASGSYTGKAGRNIVVQVTSAGGVGTAKYKVSLDGGVTWSANDAFTTSAGDVDVTGASAEGVNVRFAAGGAAPVDFAVGDTFTIDTFVPELQKAQNAIVSVDGVQVSRSGNTFSDVIDGVSFTAKKVSGDPQTITVANSSSGVSAKISAFANAYNTLVDTVAKATAYDTKNNSAAPLFGDAGVASILSTLRTSLTASVASNKTYTTLSSIGLTFDGSGHLSVDASKVGAALKTNLDEVQKLFIEAGKSSNSGIQLSRSSDKTRVGSYNINITTAAAQASVGGGRALEGTGLAANETLTIAYNDTAVSVGLTAGQKIDEIVDTLNQTFRDKSMAVQASSDGGKLKLASINYGGAQTVSVFSNQDAAAAGQLGIGTTLLKNTGVDVAGTINGLSATGSGQILKGPAGSDAEGMELMITALTPASGTLALSHGVALGSVQSINGMTDGATGLFAARKSGYDARLKDYDAQIQSLSDRLDAEQARMTKQFNDLETKLSALQSQGNSLLSQLAALAGK